MADDVVTEHSARVYRLEILYPDGSQRPGWRPRCWGKDEYLYRHSSRKQRRELSKKQFRWPRERMFLSSSGAYSRAGLLRWYGAEVAVLRSEPVSWSDWDWTDESWSDAMDVDWAEAWRLVKGIGWPEFDLSGLPTGELAVPAATRQ
jgi:hypothetical protein